MSVTAIPTDIVAPPRFDVGRPIGPALQHQAFDFADLLIAAQLQEAIDLLSPVSPLAPAAPAPRIEAGRSVSLLGHVRTTVITFTDGTNETQSVVVDGDRGDVPIQPFPLSWTRIAPPIEANSDLEPEVGLNARHRSTEASSGWHGRKLSTGTTPARPAGFGKDPRPSIEDASPIDPADMGRLIDVLG